MRKSTVLIVDDEPKFISLMVDILQDKYQVFTANSGYSAITMAMNTRPSVILLDVHMPDMTGFEVMSALKYMDETRNVPVILITDRENPNEKLQGIRLGAIDFMNKDLTDEIEKKIREQAD